MRPIVGVTTHLEDDDYAKARRTYARAIARAGGAAVYLPPPSPGDDFAGLVGAYLDTVDALVLTGGDDPVMETFGSATDERVTPVHADRQDFELALLAEARERGSVPVLGVCLGMQYMALEAGGSFDQWMPDSLGEDGAAAHWADRTHRVVCAVDHPVLADGEITSHHRQRVLDAGSLRVVATAEDDVIEAIDDPGRPFWLGVQWHPERTGPGALGDGVFEALVSHARKAVV